MRTQLLALSLISGLSLSSVAFAEPAVQAGETLESLSKVKVTTTVNGQPGSINDLVSSGQVKIVGDTTATTAPENTPAIQAPDGAAQAGNPVEAVQPAAAPEAESLSEAPQQLSNDANDADNVDPIN